MTARMPDLPELPALLAAIRARPDDESAWLALAAHDRDDGRDEAADDVSRVEA